MAIDDTHDPGVHSWVESANDPQSDFPIQNLPFGVFKVKGGVPRVGVAIGDSILDLAACFREGLFEGEVRAAGEACVAPNLNRLMSLDAGQRVALRARLHSLLRTDTHKGKSVKQMRDRILVTPASVEMCLPAAIGDYTDFYASVYHATNVGSMLRPDNPLLPNYKHVPIGYHGRASSIVVSGTTIRRPQGQVVRKENSPPVFVSTTQLDYELELGFYVGPGNGLGTPISINEARRHIFGVCLVNDWSARDIQRWEYQPLGPFLAKNFATAVSPWVVTVEALEPFRVPAFDRPAGDPSPLPYLMSPEDQQLGGISVELEVYLQSAQMVLRGLQPTRVSRGNFKDMYWTIAQMLTHHSSNGCNMQPGDLLASGTVSGSAKDSRGCLLELTWRGSEPLRLPSGEERKFLEDGDEVTMRGRCGREGFRSIGLGECRGTTLGSS